MTHCLTNLYQITIDLKLLLSIIVKLISFFLLADSLTFINFP